LLPGERLEQLVGDREDFPEGAEVIAELKRTMLDWDFEQAEGLKGVSIPHRRIDAYQIAQTALQQSTTLDSTVREQAIAVIAGRIAELRQEA
jgi:hypothetical protein